MRIDIICVGKVKEKYLKEAIDEYVKRITPYSSVNIVAVMDEPFSESDSPKRKLEIKKAEGDKIISKIRDSSFVIACDLGGNELTSEELSKYFGKLSLDGKSDISFIIGGALGLSDDVLKRSNDRVSFSKMTFPHQLMRVILLEQIYRAFKIYRNEPYHY